eukprot:scaffold5108_cov119-Skeletonema_menzelii.AAC.1
MEDAEIELFGPPVANGFRLGWWSGGGGLVEVRRHSASDLDTGLKDPTLAGGPPVSPQPNHRRTSTPPTALKIDANHDVLITSKQHHNM